MLSRRVTPLMKKLCRPSQLAMSHFRNLGQSAGVSSFSSPSSSSSCFSSRNMINASQKGSEHSKSKYGGFLWMLLNGKAALVFGGSCSFVFAEGNSNGKSSESDVLESTNPGLQKVEDGSFISNEHTSKWRVFTDSGRDFFLQGKLIEAEKLFSSALAEAKNGFGERDPHVASACNNLAELYRVQKSFDKAEPLYVEAINILEEAFGLDDIRVGSALHNLGQFYIVQRKFEEARKCYERSLKIKGRVLGHGHADYAETMFHLGTVLYLQGNAKDAESLIQDSIHTLEEGGQGESFTCIRKLRYLAKIYITSNQLAEAENVQRKILHIMELTKGWDSLDTVSAAESLSITLKSSGKLREARELLERCLNVRKTLLPQDHIQIGANFLGLANLDLMNYKQMKKLSTPEAISELDRARELVTNSVRISQLVLDGTKGRKDLRRIGKDEHIALLILLQSLKTLALIEMAKQESTGDAGLVVEAEKSLRRCIRAYKEHAAMNSTSTSIEVKGEYVGCLQNLLSLITDTTKDQAEVRELNDDIRHAEEEISSRKKHNL